jgi:hypothetical protein
MLNYRVLSPCVLTTICCIAVAQPQYRITNIVARTTINDDDANKIKNYARGWAQALLTTDTSELFNAQQHLIEPLEPEVEISSYARSLYGNALEDGFAVILSEESDNEMAAVNALQVLSLLGTDQACNILLDHATMDEERSSLRLWSSIGLGKSFKSGVLSTRRVTSNANTLADYASRESEWYIVARQFDSLAAMQDVPDLDRRQQIKLENQSLQLQTRALQELLDDLKNTAGGDKRVQALPFILPSLRIQFAKPGIDATARSEAQKKILPMLINFVDYSTVRAKVDRNNTDLLAAYGNAIFTAGMILDEALDINSNDDVTLADHWIAGNHQAINEWVERWKSQLKN